MYSADSQRILPLCVYVHLCTCALHARAPAQQQQGSRPSFIRPFLLWHPHVMLKHSLPDHVAYMRMMRKHMGSRLLGISFYVSVMSGKLIKQICLTDLALVTSQACLLYLLGNLKQEHTF